MEIRLTSRGQALVKRIGKKNTGRRIRKPILKQYTLIHIEVKNKKKIEWSEKVWIDESKPYLFLREDDMCIRGNVA